MFEELLSNNRMKAELTHAVTNDKPMQAYLFCGAAGSGKKTAALALARELVGVNAQKVQRGSHPDVIFICPTEGKKLISVEQLRDMRADAFIKPSEGNRKIYIIDGVQLMNDAGQNALLTILEQPPSFAIFILLTQIRGKVLPTVISRCAVFDMEYVPPGDGAEFLQNRYPEIPYQKLYQVMHAAQGNVGLAFKLAASAQFDVQIGIASKICIASASKNEYEAAKTINKIGKDEISDFLPVLAMLLRDITVYLSSKNPDMLVFRDIVLQNSQIFDKIDINILCNGITACENALELIAGNVNYTLAASSVVIMLCGGKQID